MDTNLDEELCELYQSLRLVRLTASQPIANRLHNGGTTLHGTEEGIRGLLLLFLFLCSLRLLFARLLLFGCFRFLLFRFLRLDFTL